MGFFGEGLFGKRRKPDELPIEDIHKLGCKICPLNKEQLTSPKMKPTGADNPLIYIIGEAPGQKEDDQGRQFVGPSGDYLRKHLPKDVLPLIRWSNTIQCRPPKDRSPEDIEIEACRPRWSKDIEQTKPEVIFGFGSVPLGAFIDERAIGNWRGRRIPVKIGNHSCWYFAFHHPSFLIRQQNENKGRPTDNEHMFALDIKRALASVNDLPPAEVHSAEDARANIETVMSFGDDQVERICKFLKAAAEFDTAGVDYETNGNVRPYANDARIISMAIATPKKTLAFPFDHPKYPWREDRLAKIMDAVLAFFRAPRPRKAVHHLAFEDEWTGYLLDRSILRASFWDDTISQAFVLDQRPSGHDEDGVEIYGLGFLTLLYFGINIKTLSIVNRKAPQDEPLEKLLPYNGMDAKYHRLLMLAQDAELAEQGLSSVYEQHLRRVPTCVLTQIKGLPIDLESAHGFRKQYDGMIEDVLSELATSCGKELAQFEALARHEFNPVSNPDVVRMCKDVLKSTAGLHADGSYSVDENALKKINHKFGKITIDLRSALKMASTYVFDEQSAYLWPDGMLHPQLNHAKARTARLTSTDPNGQNIPKRDGEQKQIRKQFCALKDHVFLAADYGQIEARVFGMASKDPTWVKSLWEDYDIHSDWARRIGLAVPRLIGGKDKIGDKQVMADFREKVKSSWVFALFFDAMLRSVAGYFGVLTEGDEWRQFERLEKEFWAMFPTIKKWKEDTRKFYDDHGYVELLTGRRRCGPMKFNAPINTPIQGTACEIVLDGMSRISELDIWEIHPILQVHDELIFHVHKDMLEDAAEVALKEMLRPNTFSFINVPLSVDLSFGPNLYDMEKIGKFSSIEFYSREEHAQ